MSFRRKLDQKTQARIDAIRDRARGLSRCGGIRPTVSVPVLTMAELTGVQSC